MAKYLLRIAGSVTGPFTRDEVARMLDRELLSAVHEVSADGKTWLPIQGGIDRLPQPNSDAAPQSDQPDLSGLIAPSMPAAWGSGLAPAAPVGLLAVVDAMQLTALSCGLLVLFTATLPVGHQEGAPAFAWNLGAGPAVCYAGLWIIVLGAIAAPWIATLRRGELLAALALSGAVLSLTLSVFCFVRGDGGRFAALEAIKLLTYLGAWATVVAATLPELGRPRRPASEIASLPPAPQPETPL